MYLVNTGLLGKVNLPPIPGAARSSDSFAGRFADVPCHSSMIGLVFTLYLAHTLFGMKGALIRHAHPGDCGWDRLGSLCSGPNSRRVGAFGGGMESVLGVAEDAVVLVFVTIPRAIWHLIRRLSEFLENTKK